MVAQKSLAEGFGLTVAGAMWKGRPVAATRVGGVRDQIEDSRTGCLVAPRDLFLGSRHLGQYVDLLERVSAAGSIRSSDRAPPGPAADAAAARGVDASASMLG